MFMDHGPDDSENFEDAIRAYIQRYKFDNAVQNDLYAELDKVSWKNRPQYDVHNSLNNLLSSRLTHRVFSYLIGLYFDGLYSDARVLSVHITIRPNRLGGTAVVEFSFSRTSLVLEILNSTTAVPPSLFGRIVKWTLRTLASE